MSWFIPRNRKLYAFMAHISWPMRYGISLILCLSLASAWYYLLYNPAQQRLNYYRSQLQDIAHKKTHLASSPCGLTSALHEHEELQKKYQGMNAAPTNNNDECIMNVVSAARTAGLTVQSCDSGKKDITNVVTLTAQGTFEQIAQLLDTLWTQKQIIHCAEFNLMNAAADKYTMSLVLQY